MSITRQRLRSLGIRAAVAAPPLWMMIFGAQLAYLTIPHPFFEVVEIASFISWLIAMLTVSIVLQTLRPRLSSVPFAIAAQMGLVICGAIPTHFLLHKYAGNDGHNLWGKHSSAVFTAFIGWPVASLLISLPVSAYLARRVTV